MTQLFLKHSVTEAISIKDFVSGHIFKSSHIRPRLDLATGFEAGFGNLHLSRSYASLIVI